MFIPYGMSYTATVHGIVWKFVLCERCATNYAYRMEVRGSATSTDFLFLNKEGAEGNALVAAGANMASQARRSKAAVPCPVCGHYQKDMASQVRGRSVHWLQILGGLLLAAIPVGFLIEGLPGQIAAGALGLVGMVIWYFGFLARNRFDPNAGDPALRQQLGQSLAVWGKELERLIQQVQVSEE